MGRGSAEIIAPARSLVILKSDNQAKDISNVCNNPPIHMGHFTVDLFSGLEACSAHHFKTLKSQILMSLVRKWWTHLHLAYES